MTVSFQLGAGWFAVPFSWDVHQEEDHWYEYFTQVFASGAPELHLVPDIEVH